MKLGYFLKKAMQSKYKEERKLTASSRLKSLSSLKSLKNQIVKRAQKVYDEWDEEDEDTYARGGICHLIADAICDLLTDKNYECSSVSASVGEQHVYTVVQLQEGIFTVDISPYVYEKGSGYHWVKLPNVKFNSNDIDISQLSSDPEDFETFLDT